MREIQQVNVQPAAGLADTLAGSSGRAKNCLDMNVLEVTRYESVIYGLVNIARSVGGYGFAQYALTLGAQVCARVFRARGPVERNVNLSTVDCDSNCTRQTNYGDANISAVFYFGCRNMDRQCGIVTTFSDLSPKLNIRIQLAYGLKPNCPIDAAADQHYARDDEDQLQRNRSVVY